MAEDEHGDQQETLATAEGGGPPPNTPAKERKPTKYLILRKGDKDLGEDPDAYKIVGTHDGHGAENTVLAWAEQSAVPGGDFVGVPQTNWTEVPLATETQTRLVVKT